MNKLDLTDTRDRNLGKILQLQSEQNGETDFLITDKQRISFAEAELITNCLASGFKSLGIEAGDRVAIYMGNRPEMVLLALSLNKLGAIWVPINTDYKGEWLLDTLLRSRCKILVTDEPLQTRLGEVQDRLDGVQLLLLGDIASSPLNNPHSYDELLASEPLRADYSFMDYGDTCAILWTSGTTGKSKGVMQSHNAWIRPIVQGCSEQYNTREGDIIYCVLPLFNSAAWLTCILRALLEGVSCVIEERFSVSQFLARVKEFGATQTFAVGAMGVFLMDSPEQGDDVDTPLTTAQIVPMPPDLWPKFEKRFGVRLLRSGLGQSECLLILTQLEDREDVPVYALGFPQPDTDIRLFDDEGVEVANGEVGEICIKPLEPHILFNGYFDSPEATADAYRGEWYLTGDIGRKDPDTGAFFFVDRKKDALRFAGRNISTLEVESVVRRHPAVQDVAAFGIPSKEVDSEHELKLNIILRRGQSPSCEDICAFINENAPHYFVPRYMEFVDSLPYTPTNKVQKFKLREAGVSAACWDIKQSNYRVVR
ncbi:MAG: AMP-binding protein [Proteobacteria bacterium]|nr:AMP-binding protein [Pseudomonadota bacterium]